MFSFEGDFRRKPVQSFAGASRKEPKEQLIQRTQEDRRKREAQKRQLLSALKIQACFRSSSVRHKMKVLERIQFDDMCHELQTTNQSQLDPVLLTDLTRKILFFFNSAEDASRLTWFCQTMVKNRDIVIPPICSQDKIPLHQIKRLLVLCCKNIETLASTSTQLAMPLRMLEVYLDTSIFEKASDRSTANLVVENILRFLVCNGYFKCIRVLIDNRIPESLQCDNSSAPPTPLAGTVLSLIKQLLEFARNSHPQFRIIILRLLSVEMFSKPYSFQVRNFLLPFLAFDAFPFTQLLEALVPSESMSGNNVSDVESVCPFSKLDAGRSVFLLHSLMFLSRCHLEHMNEEDYKIYLTVLQKLVPCLKPARRCSFLDEEGGEDCSDSEEEVMEVDVELNSFTNLVAEIRQECLQMFGLPDLVHGLLSLSQSSDHQILTALCTLCHAMMIENKMVIHKTRLLYTLAFNPTFIRNLWEACANVYTASVTGVQTSLLQMLSRGLRMAPRDFDRIIPLLSIFCSLFSHCLMSLHDKEFHGNHEVDFSRAFDSIRHEEQFSNSYKSALGESLIGSKSGMPFDTSKVSMIAFALRDCCLGIIDLTHPDTKPTLESARNVMSQDELLRQQEALAYIFKVTVNLVKQLYERDCRQSFCAEGHWLAPHVIIKVDKPSQLLSAQTSIFVRRPFGALSILNPKKTNVEDAPNLSTAEIRKLIILTDLPFVVPFQERVKIFQRLVHQDKAENQSGDHHHFGYGHAITIRRTHLYEDAFEKLSFENEPNVKLRLQVQLVNFAGLDEAGVDGGGIFREFMSELIKTAFDPNRGFFKSTSDKLLYPNPQAKLIIESKEDLQRHYFFLGRILGKVIYENMLTELPFASFFLSKLLSRQKGNVDIHHLASLDPVMYKGLLFLKDYSGDVATLGLDFTVANNQLGTVEVDELKPGGRDISVTNHNCIEYMHLMADYRLNKQISLQCSAFREGLAQVVNIEWLRMFDHNELQVLISGAEVPIDLEDLKQHTNYSGGYGPEHPVIVMFWKVVESFTDKQKRQLLKFATSCSRPPLLGFKELFPAFCIHYAGNELDRLPTASTCMNLLKLPEFQDEDTLRLKLVYAVESGAGFELS